MRSAVTLCFTCFLFFVFCSCEPSKSVSFNITQPAQITLPAEANKMLLIDRTKPANQSVNIMEGILTGELPGDDRVAAQEALNSLKNKLEYSPRFSVKILPDRFQGNSMTAAFPAALDWNFINDLCQKNQSEVVVALEVFDSDFIVTHGTRIKKKTEGTGDKKKEVEYTEYYAQGVGNVKMGIRTYYNNTQTIIDQQMVSKDNRWEAVGTSAADAAALLISKSKANVHLASAVGEDYAYKISPMPVRISRSFYGKSRRVPELAEGSRYADVNKWKEAIDTWKRGIPGAKTKDAGRLAYNIATGYEVMGEYGSALTWAQDAYTKYGNKSGRSYAYGLQQRIDQEYLLKEQMSH